MALDASARYYTPFWLGIYDIVVLAISNSFAWRCPTRTVLLPFFQRNLGENAHLDVGVGTGYYPAASASQLAKAKNVTVFDLNGNTLNAAEARLRRAGYTGVIEKVERSVFDPVPESLHGKFDGISLFYLLHCLPGSFPSKAERVVGNLAPVLAPGGVLYGATVLGLGVTHNWLGTFLINFYNKHGVFDNRGDSLEGLEKGLKVNFNDVQVKQIGRIALFEARQPIRK